MCNQGGPGKPGPLAVLSNVSHFWKRNIVLLLLLEEVSCIPEDILCEVHMVKVQEGIVQNSLSCHTIPIALLALWNLCSFSCCTVSSILHD